MGRVEASFQFLNYKIDFARYVTDRSVAFLDRKAPLEPEELQLGARIKNPTKLPNNEYAGGLALNLNAPNEESEEPRFELEMGITGLFQVQGDDLDDELIDKLVKFQIPAILFPYLRSAMTGFLANAGFPSIFLPLINVNRLAEQSNLKIQEVTETISRVDSPANE
jgi:preprotein translocase subunit SecB